MIAVLRQQLRRDRVILSIWILAIALTLLGSASAVASEYGSAAERAAVLKIALATPSLLALRGNPNGSSAGSLLWFQLFTFLAVAVGLMNTFFATRHGRADEEQGRRELLAASPIRRMTPPASAVVLGTAANVVVGALSAGGLALVGYGGIGAILAGAALAAVGICFLGIGMLASELAATSRSANSIGVVAVLVAYTLRGAGDALGAPDFDSLSLTPAWPSWLSPIGWAQQTLAFTDNRIWPILLPLVMGALTIGAALVIHARRDLGASLLSERAGRAAARWSLRSSFGLDWRLHWPSLAGWAIGSALLGTAVGSLASALKGAVLENPQIASVMQSLAPGQHLDTVGLFISTVMVMIGILAAAAGIQGVLRLRDEEANGRAELLLSAPVSRRRWLADALGVGVIATVVVLVLSGLTTFASFAAAGGSDDGWRALGQAAIELPAALVPVVAAALLIAVVPRISTLAAWLLFATAVVVGLFGSLMKLPQGVLNASPFSNVPAVPVVDWGPSVILMAVDVALALAAVMLIRRRDLST